MPLPLVLPEPSPVSLRGHVLGHLSLLSNCCTVFNENYVVYEPQLDFLGEHVSTKVVKMRHAPHYLRMPFNKHRVGGVEIPVLVVCVQADKMSRPHRCSKDYLDCPKTHTNIQKCELVFAPKKKDPNTDRQTHVRVWRAHTYTEAVCHNTACHNIYSQVKMHVCL